MTMSEQECPHSFCGFSFDDMKEWLENNPSFIPICREKCIFLQYSGWSINLYRDGSYAVEVTEGG